nr:RNA polymerase sigma factor [uncultured Allomuricauda sp.]
MDKDLENTYLNMLDSLQERIFRICISYAKDTEDAKDLFQEVLVNIWKSLPNFKGDSSLSTWVYRITINVSLRFKTNLIKDRIKFSHANSIEIERVETREEERPDEEKLLLLRACVRSLNEVDKAITTLFLEELSYREISTITGLKENTVAVRIKRIKKKLLNCINEKL